MARTKIPAIATDRLNGKLAVWMLSAQTGSEQSRDRIKTAVWTLQTVGLSNGLIDATLRDAANSADIPASELEAYLTIQTAQIDPVTANNAPVDKPEKAAR